MFFQYVGLTLIGGDKDSNIHRPVNTRRAACCPACFVISGDFFVRRAIDLGETAAPRGSKVISSHVPSPPLACAYNLLFNPSPPLLFSFLPFLRSSSIYYSERHKRITGWPKLHSHTFTGGSTRLLAQQLPCDVSWFSGCSGSSLGGGLKTRSSRSLTPGLRFFVLWLRVPV